MAEGSEVCPVVSPRAEWIAVDVVNVGGLLDASPLVLAGRVCLQVLAPGLLPLGVIATLGCRWTLGIMCPLVLLGVVLTEAFLG